MIGAEKVAGSKVAGKGTGRAALVGLARGALIGGMIGALVCLTFLFLGLLLEPFSTPSLSELWMDVPRALFALLFGAACGAVAGGLSGFAASAPGAPSFLWSCGIVCGVAALVRWATAPQAKLANPRSDELSYVATLAAAILASAAMYFLARRLSATDRDASSASRSQIDYADPP